MAEELPSDYDAIVLGTGFPESVVAASLARIGYKVLHLDRNDYYSGYWGTFSFQGLQEWIEQNSKEETEDITKGDEKHGDIFFPTHGSGISNIEVRSYLRDGEIEDSEGVEEQFKENRVSFGSYSMDENVQKGVDDLTNQKPAHLRGDSCDPSEDAQNILPAIQDKATESGQTAIGSNSEVTVKTEATRAVNTVGKGNRNIETQAEQPDLILSSDEAPKSPEDDSNKLSDVAIASDLEPIHPNDVTGSPDNHKSSRSNQSSGEHAVENEDNKVAETNISPLSESEQNKNVESSEETSQVYNVHSWAEKRKLKNGKKLGKDSTVKDFSEKSRKFNLDLSPKCLFSRGLLVESLINANISHYAEFKIVSRILTYLNGNIEEVPCSRSDVFGSELINVLEKRALMRFMTFCSSFEDFPEQYESMKEEPFVDFLKCRKLTDNLQHIILNAIAGVAPNTSTLSGLKATQRFLRSLGRYGNTPFLWSLYGAGELPQAFCRMSAVFGGIYCLRKNVKSLVLDEENKNCVAVISEDGQRLNTRWLIIEKSYIPNVFEKDSHSMTSRAILITDRSLKQAEREHISMLTIPSSSNGCPIRVIELTPSSMACPESLYVVHFTTETSLNALEDIKPYVEELFTTPDVVNCGSEKPVILWSVYFNMESGVTNISTLPVNVRITSPPSAQLDFEDALIEAKNIFASICPNEDFLPAVPNPEDILWDDGESSTMDTPSEQASEASADVLPAIDQQYSDTTKNSSIAKHDDDSDQSNANVNETPEISNESGKTEDE